MKFKATLAALLMAMVISAPAHAVLRFNEDAPATSGDQGIQGLTVRSDTPAATAGTTGDYQPMITGANGAIFVQSIGGTTGGLSVYRNLDVDETTGTTTQQVKATAGTLYQCAVTNDTAATKEYVKFYDAVSLTGSAAGTEIPIITLPIAGATTQMVNFGGNLGVNFATGLTVAATTGIADADTGAPATNAIIINCAYK